MNTKILYVCTSTDEDIYLEQCWASAYSVKIHNPDAHISILTDKDTENNILTTDRKNILSVVDEIIAVDIPAEFSKMERSRWLKTSMRKFIGGGVLYIDTDTIVTSSLAEIDNFNDSLGMVVNLHVPNTGSESEKYNNNLNISFFGHPLKPTTEYFNGGVMYFADNEHCRKFFDTWHKNWLITRSKGVSSDQQSLVETADTLGNPTELSGEWNAQVYFSIKYLSSAKIVHFYTHHPETRLCTPFMSTDIYKEIKHDRGISKEMDYKIRNCRQMFESPSSPIGRDYLRITMTNTFLLMVELYTKHHNIYRFFSGISKVLLKFFK